MYCISGKDKRFPALFETVLRKKYALPHPNCRHEFIPFYLDIESEEDIQKAIKDSKIKYDKNGNLVDVRFESDIKGYAAWQAGNRQRHEEYKQFQAMKAYYEGIEKEMPYKTLAGFRLARRREEKSAKYKAWKYRKADEKQFNRWIKIVGKQNMPETLDEFQKIKYNEDKVKDYQLLRKSIQDFNLYKKDNINSKFDDFLIVRKLKENGVKGKINLPPKIIDVNTYIFDDSHINKDRKHFVEKEEAIKYVANAIISIVKWNGQVVQYFSLEGATYVNLEKGMIVTSFKSAEYDDNVKKILSEVLKNGNGE